MHTTTKIIYLDLDGTLLDDNKNVPEKNMAAISEALQKGHKVVICTGRPLCSTKKQFDALGMNREGCYAIAYNGGQIYDIFHQITLFKQTIPLKYVRYIFEKAAEHDIYVQTYTDNDILCQEDTKEGVDYSRRLLIERVIVPDVFEIMGEEKPCKALAIAKGYDRKKLEAFREVLTEWAEDRVNMFFSCYEFLEFVPKGISKGAGIRFLAEHLNIPMENTIAVGDAENDIAMIECAGLGVAMQNAGADIKIHADYITEADNNQGGVAEVIRKFML